MQNANYMSCYTYNNIGIVNRIVLTVIIYYVIYKFWYKKGGNKTIDLPKTQWFFIAFAGILTILDSSDRNWSLGFYSKPDCSKTFYYQITDKINDSISYLASWYVFGLDNLYLYFALFRCIGIILFGLSRNAIYLILFPDLNKEYLVYLFLFGYNYSYIWMLVIGKMAYEYYHHTITNNQEY